MRKTNPISEFEFKLLRKKSELNFVAHVPHPKKYFTYGPNPLLYIYSNICFLLHVNPNPTQNSELKQNSAKWDVSGCVSVRFRTAVVFTDTMCSSD